MKRFLGYLGILFLLTTTLVLFTFMGFFNRFFRGHRPNQKASHSLPSHREDRAAYLSTIDNDKVGSILVDLGLKAVAPIPSKPIRLRIDASMNHPSENGLPLPKEFQRLDEIDEELNTILKSKIGATYAGHLYCQGKVSWYYYVGEHMPIGAALYEAMSDFPDYKYDYKVDREERWESYRDFLYPLPIQMQSIQNGKVIENLRREGDPLEKERLVQHWIYFKAENDRERFIKSIEGLGFRIESKHGTTIGDSPFALQISRFDPVDHASVDSYVLDLWRKANEVNGEYDGWETEVMRK